MNLLLLEAEEVAEDGTAVLRDRRARHLREVLRARTGQVLRAGVVDGPMGEAEILEAAPGRVVLRCRLAGEPPARPPVDLLLALPRPKVLKRLLPALAAMGLGRILLTNAEKVERMYFDTHVLTPDFLRARLVEGLEQARDTRLPVVGVHRRLKVLLEDELNGLCPQPARLYGDPAAPASVAETLRGHAGERVLLAVGPEGGWTDYERDLLQAHGFAAAGFGARILRSDVACIAFLALAHDALRG